MMTTWARAGSVDGTDPRYSGGAVDNSGERADLRDSGRMPSPTVDSGPIPLLSPPGSVIARAAVLAVVLPADVAFSHGTAALIWGLDCASPEAGGDTLEIMRRTGAARIRRAELIGRSGLEHRMVCEVQGLRVTGAADTLADLAALPEVRVSTLALTLGIAQALRTGLITTTNELQQAVARRPRAPGRERLIRAASVLVRAEAPPGLTTEVAGRDQVLEHRRRSVAGLAELDVELPFDRQ